MRLWIPLFLFLPFVAGIVLLLTPLMLVAALALWHTGMGRPLLAAGPLLYRCACEMRGLEVDIGNSEESVFVRFR